jgi:NADH:ubiquinone oxidoreductase subunit 4 (subunit M)
LLSLLIFIPILGAVAVMLLPRAQAGNAKIVATLVTAVNLAARGSTPRTSASTCSTSSASTA